MSFKSAIYEKMEVEIKEFEKEMGIDKVVKPSEVQKYLGMSRAELNTMNNQELDGALLVLSQYYVFIASAVGRAESESNRLDIELEDELNKGASTQSKSTLKERKAIFLKTNPEIAQLSEESKISSEKYLRVRLIPDSIKEMIQSVKAIYRRRTGEKQVDRY
jgi:hypothetical protein